MSLAVMQAAEIIRHVTRTLAVDITLWSDDVCVVDSTPVECDHLSRLIV